MPLITPQPADPLTPGRTPPARPPARAGAGAPAVPLGSVAPSVGAYRTCCRRARSRASVSPRPQRTSCHAEQPLAHGTGRLERRLPHQFGRVNRNKVPANAVLAQTVIASIAAAIIYFPNQSPSSNYATNIYPVLLAAGDGRRVKRRLHAGGSRGRPLCLQAAELPA